MNAENEDAVTHAYVTTFLVVLSIHKHGRNDEHEDLFRSGKSNVLTQPQSLLKIHKYQWIGEVALSEHSSCQIPLGEFSSANHRLSAVFPQ